MLKAGTSGKYVRFSSLLMFFNIFITNPSPLSAKNAKVYQFVATVLYVKIDIAKIIDKIQTALLLFLNCLYKNIGIVNIAATIKV